MVCSRPWMSGTPRRPQATRSSNRRARRVPGQRVLEWSRKLRSATFICFAPLSDGARLEGILRGARRAETVIAIGSGGRGVKQGMVRRTQTASARGRQGIARAGIVAVVALLSLSALAAPAAAASTYDWTLSCKGNGSATVGWTWTTDGANVGSGSTRCSGDEDASASGAARPDGANGITVTVLAAAGCGKMHWRTVSETFSADGTFKVSLNVASADHVKGTSCAGHYHERAAFVISG